MHNLKRSEEKHYCPLAEDRMFVLNRGWWRRVTHRVNRKKAYLWKAPGNVTEGILK